jgi:hypothetical protein
MPGLRFKFVLMYAVSRHPWVQVPAGEIGVVIAQVGEPLPIGAKSAVYRPEFGNFTDVAAFVAKLVQEGVPCQEMEQCPHHSGRSRARSHHGIKS